MSVFLVRESCDMQCDGVAGAVPAREKPLAANRATDGHGAQASRHIAECHREKLAFDLAFAACLVLQRTMQKRAFERCNSSGRIAKLGTLRKCRGEREAIVVSGDIVVAKSGQAKPAVTGAGVSTAAGGGSTAGRSPRSPRSPSLPVSDRDFSSFIIGDGETTSSVFATIRWRRTASLNLNACSISVSVSPPHSMFINT